MQTPEPNIHLLTEEEGGYPPGWYWSDEAQLLEGPYDTITEARTYLNQYVLLLLGDDG